MPSELGMDEDLSPWGRRIKVDGYIDDEGFGAV